MTTGTTTTPAHAPRGWTLVGPGLVVAATGVGAADLVATLVAGLALMRVRHYAARDVIAMRPTHLAVRESAS